MDSPATRNERWRAVVGFEGLYEVSDRGRVRNARTDYVLSPYALRDGYLQVRLPRSGEMRRKNWAVHRLVLAAFVGPCPEGMEGCHNDGNRTHNTLDNLRWDTRSGNAADSLLHGTHRESNKTHCPRGHLLEKPNLSAAALRRGRRACLACHAGRTTRRRHGGDLRELADRHYTRIMQGACPVCVNPIPGQPAHQPSPGCTNRPTIVPHCGCPACFG